MINEFLVDGASSIQDCTIKLRNNEKGVVFIVDSDQKLLGSLTHSDITKLILNDIPLNSHAKEYMNNEVKFFRERELSDQTALINKINAYCFQAAGQKTIKWDGRNNIGKSVSAGIYLYRIHTGEFLQTKKIVLLK